MATVQQILNAESYKPTFAFSANKSAPLPPSITLDRGSAAWTYNAGTGRFEKKVSGQPRIYGPNQELLFEANSITNYCQNSTSIAAATGWQKKFIATTTQKTSIVEEETAYLHEGGGSTGARLQQANAGAFSSREEVFWAIIEKDTADNVELRVTEQGDGADVGRAEYTFSTDATTLFNGIEVNSEVLTENGPNGGTVVVVVVRYDPRSGTDYSTVQRRARLYVDRGGNGNGSILHHAQIEEYPWKSSLIVTQSSSNDRSAENLYWDITPWNPDEGTFILKARIPMFHTDNTYFLSQKNNQQRRYFYESADSPPYTIIATDGGAGATAGDVKPNELFRAVTTFGPDKFAISVDGSHQEQNHNGNLLAKDTLTTGQFNSTLLQVSQLEYIPKKLSLNAIDALSANV